VRRHQGHLPDTRSIVEPAGALGVAAIKQYVATHKTKGETYAAILRRQHELRPPALRRRARRGRREREACLP
jgi:threonine dehydratase